MKKSVHMPNKVISLFMAFLIIAMSVPLAFAAEPINLTEANVAVWPTATGEIYFGQKISDGITLSGGTVTLDGTTEGTIVSGKFEFVDSNLQPIANNAIRASIKFVPDDEQNYIGFEIKDCRNVTFTVKKATPVFVDEVNDPPVASEVEAGAKLSSSTLTGGKVINPYDPNEPKALAGYWRWVKTTTVVNESGYYQARMVISGYEVLYKDVWVQIASDLPETTIEVLPTVELTYNPNITWGEVEFTGGKAVIKGTSTEVEGKFAVTDKWKDIIPTTSNTKVEVTFTPTDENQALPVTLEIPVTVNKGTMKFADENGNEIVPEITVEHGTKIGDIHYYLEPYAKGPDVISIGIKDCSDKDLCKDGTYTAILTPRSDTENYEKTELTFKIVIKRKTLTPRLTVAVGSDGLIIRDSSGNYSPKGTFTLEYTIDGVPQEPITGIKYETAFEFNHNKSGNYEYTIIYNEAEVDEYFIIDDFTTSNLIYLTWKFSATGSVDGEYKYGDEVTLEAPATDPAKEDKPFYGFVKWVDNNGNTGLSEEELENKEITFAMPDGDVDLDATYRFDFCLCIRYYIQIVVDFFTSFFNSLGTLF